MSKYYTVIYTDFGDSCDGYARVHGTYKTKEIAKRELKHDVNFYRRANDYPEVKYEGDGAVAGDREHSCQWQILEVEV